MNNGSKIHLLVLCTIVLSSFLTTAYITMGPAKSQAATPQNATSSMANQSTGAESLMTQDQSDATMPNKTSEDQERIPANLTRGNLDPVLNNLFSAREELLRNNPISSLDALNSAGKEIFKLNSSLAAEPSDATEIRLTPLQKQIEAARFFVLQSNSTAALKHLNNADTEFIIIAQELSP